jgi:ATP-dependent DNA helicase RecG
MGYPATLTNIGLIPDAPDGWPSALSPDEFRTAFPAENDFVEFKQGASSLQDSIVAFSNAAGGIIFVGIENSGRVVGLEFSPRLADRIRQTVGDTHSPGPVAIRSLAIGDKTVAVIGVGPLTEGFAQTSQGRVLVRVGTIRPALIGNELVRFMHERAASSFEAFATDVALSNADEQLVREVLTSLGAQEHAHPGNRLRDRGLVVREGGHDVLTVAGALFLLERPDRVLGKSYVEVMRFRLGQDLPDRREEFRGPANYQVASVTKFIEDELGMDSVVLGLRRHELARLPERVVREAVANAVAHRSYELRGTATRVEMHPDRVVISSPGGLPAPVTVETMRDAYVARNNSVIQLLRRFQLAEDSGKGVDLIQDLMRDELLEPPHFSATPSSVTVALPILSATRPEERAWVREVVARGTIENKDRVLLVHARRGEALTNQRARELLKTGRDGATSALRRLVDADLLVRSGRTAGTRYRLTESLAPPAGLRLSRTELHRMVLEMAQAGPVTNSTVRARTGLDRVDVLGLFEELVTGGQLERVGSRRGTRYIIPKADMT